MIKYIKRLFCSNDSSSLVNYKNKERLDAQKKLVTEEFIKKAESLTLGEELLIPDIDFNMSLIKNAYFKIDGTVGSFLLRYLSTDKFTKRLFIKELMLDKNKIIEVAYYEKLIIFNKTINVFTYTKENLLMVKREIDRVFRYHK